MSEYSSDCFSRLYTRWAPRLFNHFRRLAWTVEDASDLTSEVLAIAWQRLGEVRDHDRVGSWLWTIARRHASNQRRSESRRRRREAVVAGERSDAVPAAASEQTRLQRALDAMDDDARQLLLWREYSGLSYREIAQLTGGSVESVRAGLYRARARLRDEYGKRME